MVGLATPFAFDEGEWRWQIEICLWAYALQHNCSTMKIQAYIHAYSIPENKQVGERGKEKVESGDTQPISQRPYSTNVL
jgi:hypothetical protein